MEPEGQKSSGGFNWVGLLFLVVFLAIVGSCIVSGVGSAQKAGKRTLCQCHGRNISSALINYEYAHNEYPGYSNVLMTSDNKVYVDPNSGEKAGVSWTIMVLRQLDRPDLDKAWKMPASQATPATEMAKQAPIKIFVCPSDLRTGDGVIPLSYVVNCGMKDWTGSATIPRDWQENGLFFDRFTGDERVAADKADQIPIVTMSGNFVARHDGLQNTILLTENVDAGNYTNTDETQVGVLWNATGTIDKSKTPPHLSPSDANMQINHGKGNARGSAHAAAFARPSSNHPGGVNIVFCDSHLNFVSEKIDYYVFCLWMSSYGQHVREPGNDVDVPDFNRPINDSWIY